MAASERQRRSAGLVLAVLHAVVAAAPAPPAARPTCGEVQGAWRTAEGAQVASFLGIPFGAPPVGRAGRWKPPRPAACWNGTLLADRPGNICYQYFGSFGGLDAGRRSKRADVESEDCLNLDVHTTNLPGTDGCVCAYAWLCGPVPSLCCAQLAPAGRPAAASVRVDLWGLSGHGLVGIM